MIKVMISNLGIRYESYSLANFRVMLTTFKLLLHNYDKTKSLTIKLKKILKSNLSEKKIGN